MTILVELVTSTGFVLVTKIDFKMFPMIAHGMPLKFSVSVMYKNHLYDLKVVVIPAMVEIDLCSSVVQYN